MMLDLALILAGVRFRLLVQVAFVYLQDPSSSNLLPMATSGCYLGLFWCHMFLKKIIISTDDLLTLSHAFKLTNIKFLNQGTAFN